MQSIDEPQTLATSLRTHTCDQLRQTDLASRVTLAGWVHRVREHGQLVFADLRDHYGITQLAFTKEQMDELGSPGMETVLAATGTVKARPDANPELPTGEIEVVVEEAEILSRPERLPFMVSDYEKEPERLRLTHRFLDLRRETAHQNIVLRSRVIAKMREVMTGLGFLEIDTPILTATSPEGARDYVVPSRNYPGKFYALPQAPQQFKQLLMTAGFDRYFQIAPCFRDEDARADRSPGEFKQLDLEMSFVSQEDVLSTSERALHEIFAAFTTDPVTECPFPRLTFDEAMSQYGSDKPDLRFENLITEVTDGFGETEFRVFRSILDGGGALWGLCFAADEIPSRKSFDKLIEFFQEEGGKGLGWLVFDGENVRGNVAKQISETERDYLRSRLSIDGQSIVLLSGGDRGTVLPALGRLRLKMAEDLGKIEEGQYSFCWVVDFPMYELDPDTGKIEFGHNPFSMPQGGIEALNTRDPLEVKAWQYDIVCNGVELSSGAIRNHDPETMFRAFEIAGYSKGDVERKFGGMLKAFRCGAPPHGGIAPGVDRIVMLLAKEPNIREVTPFPMSRDAQDLMMGAPSELDPEQVAELGMAGSGREGVRTPAARARELLWRAADSAPEDCVLASELPEHIGDRVSVAGWVAGMRDSKNRAFIVFRDGSGHVQVIAEYSELDDATTETVAELQLESSVRISGLVGEHPRKPGEAELRLSSIEVLQVAPEYPIARKEHGPDFLLDNRHLWLRTEKQVAVQKVRHTIFRAISDFLHDHAFTRIDSPILTATSCEGTTTLFPVDYFGETAFLSQSGQLYLEAAIAAHGRVYDFGPVFRSEQSKTRKHLTEFWMMDAEAAFLEHEGSLVMQEQLILFILERVLQHRSGELEKLERNVGKLEAIKGPFPRVTHKEVVKLLREMGSEITEEMDLGAPDETLLSEAFDQPVFITEWPAEIKAFYMKAHPEKPGISVTADLMAPEGYGELIGGSQREDDHDLLLGRMKAEGIPLEDFQWFLDLRKFGSVPHSEFGLGLERLTTWITGRKHIRETIPFPRTLTRLRP